MSDPVDITPELRGWDEEVAATVKWSLRRDLLIKLKTLAGRFFFLRGLARRTAMLPPGRLDRQPRFCARPVQLCLALDVGAKISRCRDWRLTCA